MLIESGPPMKVTILGCGAAPGVPSVSRGWGLCDPANSKNRRRRSSILVERGELAILVDTSPDLREQLIDAGVRRLDGVLCTHDHADHVHGIDELREVNRLMHDALGYYGRKIHLDTIRKRFDYVFLPLEKTATFLAKPALIATPVEGIFRIGDLEIAAFDQDHGYSRSTGYRFGRFAYTTDVVDFPPESFAQLRDLDLWVVSCLTDDPHPTHAHLDKVLAWVEELKPGRTIITHMSTKLDYETLQRRLPPGIEPAYDGMVLEL